MGPREQAGRGTATGGKGQGTGQGKGGRAPRQPDIQVVWCIPPGIQRLPVHHAHHQHQPIYNINPDMGDLIPPQLPQPPNQLAARPHGNAPARPHPRGTGAAGRTSADGRRPSGAGIRRARRSRRRSRGRSLQVGQKGARKDWALDWDAISDPPSGARPSSW